MHLLLRVYCGLKSIGVKTSGLHSNLIWLGNSHNQAFFFNGAAFTSRKAHIYYDINQFSSRCGSLITVKVL